MHGIGAGFVGEQKRRPELRGDGAGTDHTVDVVGCCEAARRDDGSVDARAKSSEQHGQWLAGRLRHRVKRGAMPTRGRALGHECTRAAGQCHLGFQDRGHRSDRRDAGVL